jgi:hypothetical protein
MSKIPKFGVPVTDEEYARKREQEPGRRLVEDWARNELLVERAIVISHPYYLRQGKQVRGDPRAVVTSASILCEERVSQ